MREDFIKACLRVAPTFGAKAGGRGMTGVNFLTSLSRMNYIAEHRNEVEVTPR
jgi:hypothetical protein